jgi:hypothetical protein
MHAAETDTSRIDEILCGDDWNDREWNFTQFGANVSDLSTVSELFSYKSAVDDWKSREK